MLGGTNTKLGSGVIEKREESVPSQIDELTATNSNLGGATTAFSLGMSPANVSLQRRR